MKFFYYLVPFLFFASLFAENGAQDQKTVLKKQIEELNTQKRYLESRIKRFEDKGSSLQFKEGKLQEAKQYFKMADIFREKVKDIDLQIQTKELELKKLTSNRAVSFFHV